MDEIREVTALLARALARDRGGEPLAERLCRARLKMLGARGAAITLATPRTAHAYTAATTLSDVASAVVSRRLDLVGPSEDSGGPPPGSTGGD